MRVQRVTKKAFVLSGLALAVVYVLACIEEKYPHFYTSRRSISANTTTYNAIPLQQEHISIKVPSERAIQTPAWRRKGETFARSFYDTSNHTITRSSSDPPAPWWCTQGTYDKSCRSDNHKLCSPKGLLYVKVPKSGSTTISKIVKRIVDNVARRSNLPDKCQHREDHVSGAGQWYGNRDVRESFLVASIRDPAQRAISRFFWSYVTRHSDRADSLEDDFVRDYLNKSTSVATGCTSKGQGGYQLNYVTMSSIPEWSAWSPQTPNQVINPNQVEQEVKQTLSDYDFVILNERMEESLVILKFLLGLETGDIVSLSYNVGGSYRYEHGKCKQLVKSHVSDGMKAYFEAEEWHAKNYGDYLLFAAVNRSIDLTIDQIGRAEFDAALVEFRRLEAKVNDICTQKVPFPCSANGTVLFHTKQPIPHGKIVTCIDEVVQGEHGESSVSKTWHR